MRLRVISTFAPSTFPLGFECETTPAKYESRISLVKCADGRTTAVTPVLYSDDRFFQTLATARRVQSVPRATFEVIQ